MSRAQIFFHYDVISPWSMFAFEILKRYAPVWNFDLTLRPRYLGGVMVASVNVPPATNLKKGAHARGTDMPMVSEYFGVPYSNPKVFPINTIHIQRFLRVIEEHEPSKLAKLTDLFFAGMWGPKAKAEDTAQLANFPTMIPASVLTPEQVRKYIALSTSEENKERMKTEATALVEENGAYGFPWIVVQREDGKKASFFGSDRFEVMAFWMGKKWCGPFPEERSRL